MQEPSAAMRACESVLAEGPTGALLCGPDGTVVWGNAAAAGILAADPRSLPGAPIEAVLGHAAGVLAPGVHRIVVRDGAGERRWIQCAVSRIVNGSGDGTALWLLTDLTEFESRRAGRAAVLAGFEPSRLDEVTGVLNRRTVLQRLQSEISRSRRYGNPLAAVLVGLTEPGASAAAEDALERLRRRVALGLNETLRWVDSVGTLGPDELLVVLPETPADAAERVAEKIRAACAALDAGEPTPLACTVRAAGWSGKDDVDGFVARLRA